MHLKPSHSQPRRVAKLDGAMGSELRRRGFELSSPLFSSAACLTPEGVALVKAIHADFLRAGAQSLRSNSFPLLAAVPEIGIERACEIAATSVRVAHNAIAEERATAPDARTAAE